MKKLMLVILVAFAATNVQSTNPVQAQIPAQKTVDALKQSEFLRKNKKAIYAVIATVLVAAGVGGTVYYLRDNKYVKPAIDKTKEGIEKVKGWSNDAWTYTQDHKLVVGGTLTALILAASAGVDLSRGDKSVIKAIYKKMLKNAEIKEAVKA